MSTPGAEEIEEGATQPIDDLVAEADEDEEEADPGEVGADAAPHSTSQPVGATSLRFARRSQFSGSGCGLSLGDSLGLSGDVVPVASAGYAGSENHPLQRLVSTDSMMEVPLGQGSLFCRDYSESSGEIDDTYNLSRMIDLSARSGLLSIRSAVSDVTSSGDDLDESCAGIVDSTGWGAGGNDDDVEGGSSPAEASLPAEEGDVRRSQWRIGMVIAALAVIAAAAYAVADEGGLFSGAPLLSSFGGFLGAEKQRDSLEEEDPARKRRRFEREQARMEQRRHARDTRRRRETQREEALREAIEGAARSEEWRALIRGGHGSGGEREGGGRGHRSLSAMGLSEEEEWSYHIAQWEAIERAMRLEELRPLIRGG